MADAERPWPTVRELAEGVRAGGRSAAREAVEVALAAAADDDLGAFVVVAPDAARAAADAVDAAVAAGRDPGPLAGVPIGVKDLEDCAGMPTGQGSLLYQGRGPVPHDSIHVARLRAAGAVPIGKTAAPEFGSLSWTRTRVSGTTRNPWDRTRTPGGSSGGSAAAVSAGMVPMATASDGGGSTRSPAGFTGLVGHKGSFGRIPEPAPRTLFTAVVGALTTTVGDTARHLDVAAGPARDRTSLPPPGVSYEAVIETLATTGLRARWSSDLGFAAVDAEVEAVAQAAAEALSAAAGMVLDADPITLTDPVGTWLDGGAVDGWLDLEEGMWPDRADELTPWCRWALGQSEGRTAPEIARPVRGLAVLEREVGELFSEVDVLLTPTVAVPAFVAEGPPPAEIAGREVHGAMATPFTMLANLCWNPSTSVPAGLTSEGLPVGLLITAAIHRDDLTLRLARILEQAQPWPRWAPPR